jgi:hypothetical protein
VICTSTTVRSSTRVSPGFDLPTHRSTSFGSSTNDYRRSHLVPRKLRTIGFPTTTYLKYLISPLIETHWPVLQNGRYDIGPHLRVSSLSCHISLYPPGFRLFAHPVRDTFQFSLTLLLHYRSRDIFRVGSLWLPYSCAISDAHYSGVPKIPFPTYL